MSRSASTTASGSSRSASRSSTCSSAEPRPPRYHPAMIDTPGIVLRPAVDADAERIAAIFTDEGYPAGPSAIVARLARFGGPESEVVVADRGGEVIGFLAFHAPPRFEHDDVGVRLLALVGDCGGRA